MDRLAVFREVMMRYPDDPVVLSPPDAERADAGSMALDRDEIGRKMEACRRYLLRVANQEIAPVLRPKGGASDLVQETFLEAHRDLSQFSGQSQGELRGWLRRILRNNLANFARRYRVTGKRRIGREVSLDGEPCNGLESPSLSPSGAAIFSEQVERLERARGRLRERDRLVLIWRNDDHCDWQEIGRRIGGSADKARKIWTRAVERLGREIGEAQDVRDD